MLSSVAPFYHFLTLHESLALVYEICRLIKEPSVLFTGHIRSFQHSFSLSSLRSLPGMALLTLMCARTKEQQLIPLWVSKWNMCNYCTTTNDTFTWETELKAETGSLNKSKCLCINTSNYTA